MFSVEREKGEVMCKKNSDFVKYRKENIFGLYAQANTFYLEFENGIRKMHGCCGKFKSISCNYGDFSVVMFALASELYLKYIILQEKVKNDDIEMENGKNIVKFQKGHDLKELLDKTSDDCRDFIKTDMGKYANNFDSELDSVKNCFVHWRYVYEEPYQNNGNNKTQLCQKEWNYTFGYNFLKALKNYSHKLAVCFDGKNSNCSSQGFTGVFEAFTITMQGEDNAEDFKNKYTNKCCFCNKIIQ